jgi:hypothetical protein
MTDLSSNFRGDPYGHVTNQCGHIVVGMAAYVLSGVWGALAATLIGAIYLIGWEWFVQRLRLFWDSLEDAAFVTTGALFVPFYLAGYGSAVVITVGLWLTFGAWLRR